MNNKRKDSPGRQNYKLNMHMPNNITSDHSNCQQTYKLGANIMHILYMRKLGYKEVIFPESHI